MSTCFHSTSLSSEIRLNLPSLGDLHDGNGLSDAALPNGVYSNPIFDEVDYDLLTIGKSEVISSSISNSTLGNHELYVSEIAYEQ